MLVTKTSPRAALYSVPWQGKVTEIVVVEKSERYIYVSPISPHSLKSMLAYTETNSQRNTDLVVHFFVFISIKIIFLDNTFRQ